MIQKIESDLYLTLPSGRVIRCTTYKGRGEWNCLYTETNERVVFTEAFLLNYGRRA